LAASMAAKRPAAPAPRIRMSKEWDTVLVDYEVGGLGS
jgi:hypothetical protein